MDKTNKKSPILYVFVIVAACASVLTLFACGGNSVTAASSNTVTTTTTCDQSVQPSCPSTVPSYSGQVEGIITAYCLECHDPNGIGSAATGGGGGGMPGGANPNFVDNPNFAGDPNGFNGNPNHWDPSDAHDWSKFQNIVANRVLIEQQVFLCDMPPSGASALDATSRQALLEWLACGAPNN